MNWDISQFHFIRPIWLSLLPAMVLLWWFARNAVNSGAWESYLPQPMLEALKVNTSKGSTHWQWWLLLSWIILTLAAAGPTWIKQPVPVVKNQKALVVALDLSPSMLADDVNPNRLTLAKYKLIDILRKQADGQVALIAYAGGAHTVSPLTDDPRTIEALLPALHPNVMPNSGSNTEAAIALAQGLFKDAGVPSGDILLITDGVSAGAINTISNQLDSTNSLSILGVGGTQGAPIKLQDGGFLKNSQGEIVLASLNVNDLRDLSQKLGGRYASLSTNESDINHLLQDSFVSTEEDQSINGNTSFDSWLDLAHFLVILLLPIALFCFRKGLIYVLPLVFLLPLESEASVWSDLWKTKDQQAKKLLKEEQYDQAAETFERSDWAGVAHFKNGDFSQAATQLQSSNDVTSLYNKGNAFAFQGELEKALEAYNAALTQQPQHQDALHNKQVIEALLQQQEEQEQNSNDQQDNDQNSQDQDNKNEEGESQDQQNNQDQQQDSQSSQEEQSENSESSNDNSSDKNESSTDNKPSTDQEPSADQEFSTDNKPSANQEPSDDKQPEESDSESQAQSANETGEQSKEDTEATSSQNESIAENKNETEDQGEATTAQLVETNQTPLKDSSEQWLRTIQDDPSGLLRRKFEYQSRQRKNSNGQSTNRSNEERY